MAGIFVTGSSTAILPVETLNTYYISRSATIFVSSTDAIKNNTALSYQVDVVVAGEVVSLGGTAIALRGTNATFDVTSLGQNSIRVEAGAMVYGSVAGLLVYGRANAITNFGVVDSDGTGAFMVGGDSVLQNSGQMSGGIAGIGVFGSDGVGGIVGTLNSIDNSGLISGGESGIYVSSAPLKLVNTGTIIGSGVNVAGSSVWSAGVMATDAAAPITIVNYGTISGGLAGELNSIVSDNSSDYIRNYGVLNGGMWMYDGADRVTNSGTIDGLIYLSFGNDTYKGVNQGFVSGTVYGGSGDDVLKGGNLSDDFDGGSGTDLLSGRGGNDILTDTDGNDVFWGGSGDDVMNAGAGANKMHGGTGDDIINAGSGSDKVWGGNGNDTITGGNGKDIIFGGDGNDVINGGGKSDIIHGGGGNDVMTGSSGADIFVFTQRAGDDIITDFTNNSDKLDLRGFGISSAAAIVSAATTVTGGVLIDLDLLGGSGSIFLDGFNAANLDATDFIL